MCFGLRCSAAIWYQVKQSVDRLFLVQLNSFNGQSKSYLDPSLEHGLETQTLGLFVHCNSVLVICKE